MKKSSKGSKSGKVGHMPNPNPKSVFEAQMKAQYGGPISAKVKSMINSKLEL